MNIFKSMAIAGGLALWLASCGKPLKATRYSTTEPSPAREIKVTHRVSYGKNLAQKHSVTQVYSLKTGENVVIDVPYPWRVFTRRTDIKDNRGTRYRFQYAEVLRALVDHDTSVFIGAMDAFFEHRLIGSSLVVDEYTHKYSSARLIRWKTWFDGQGNNLQVALTDSEYSVSRTLKAFEGPVDSNLISGPDFLAGESLYQTGDLPAWPHIVATKTEQMRARQKDKFPQECTPAEVAVLYAPIQALRTELEMAHIGKEAADLAGSEKYFSAIGPIYQNTASLRFDALLSTELAVLLKSHSPRVKFDIEAFSADGSQSLGKAQYSYSTTELLNKSTELELGNLRTDGEVTTLEQK